ncbi:MAG: hypothetical protein COB41_00470 [Proteobacteria bacterium]|nr:MAG: hypothetical protein COB41_00470 [Pseudomonadota bacterium]
MAKKKKSQRSKEKYPQFNPRYSPRVRAEYVDYEKFAKNLPEDEFVELPNGKKVSVKEWYHKFVSEYDGASLDFKDLSNNIHNTEELKKECTDRNNSRNRCIYGVHKAGGKVADDSRIENDYRPANIAETEDILIEILDKLSESD